MGAWAASFAWCASQLHMVYALRGVGPLGLRGFGVQHGPPRGLYPFLILLCYLMMLNSTFLSITRPLDLVGYAYMVTSQNDGPFLVPQFFCLVCALRLATGRYSYVICLSQPMGLLTNKSDLGPSPLKPLKP